MYYIGGLYNFISWIFCRDAACHVSIQHTTSISHSIPRTHRRDAACHVSSIEKNEEKKEVKEERKKII